MSRRNKTRNKSPRPQSCGRPRSQGRDRPGDSSEGTPADKPDRNAGRDDRGWRRDSAYNDISWYNKNPLLTEAAARIPFPYRAGMPISLDVDDTVHPVIPGFLVLHWAPWIDMDTDVNTAVNIAAREIFSRVRESFSGSIDADSPDFIIYFLALDSIFAYIGALKREYRIISAYNPNNRAIPQSLLEALGYTPTSIESARANKTRLWQYINELVAMASKFVCPALFPLFNRHYWMNDNVYSDADSWNSQMYVFIQDYFLKFQYSSGSDKFGELAYTPLPDRSKAGVVDTLYQYGRDLIDALSQPDDTYIISGYLARAFSGEPAFAVEPLLQNEPFTPVYVPEVLRQIENAYTCISTDSTDYIGVNLGTITQNPATNTVYAAVNFTVNAWAEGNYTHPFINSRMDVPDVEEVVECTRLQSYYDSGAGKIIAGTELNVGLWFYPLTFEALDQPYVHVVQNQIFDESTPSAGNLGVAMYMTQLMSFDWHPVIMLHYKTAAGAYYVWPGMDIHNLTVLSLDQLKQINKICLYSEFNAFGIKA